MEFEWDENKNQRNIAKHGVDFCYAMEIFNDLDRLAWEDTRQDYGEMRYITLGTIEGSIYTVVYTIRGAIYRLISARGAHRNERKTYENYLKSKGRNTTGQH